jgi:hypothetical protein
MAGAGLEVVQGELHMCLEGSALERNPGLHWRDQRGGECCVGATPVHPGAAGIVGCTCREVIQKQDRPESPPDGPVANGCLRVAIQAAREVRVVLLVERDDEVDITPVYTGLVG